MATEFDKRIYDLQSEENPLLNMFIALDKPGNVAAKRLSLQALLTLLLGSASAAKAYSDNVNPDNAFGNNGDLFFTIPVSGAYIKMWQKAAEAWSIVFIIPLLAKTILAADMDFTINWQGLVPGETQTYAEKHGNTIGSIEGVHLDGDVMRGYRPNYNYTMINGDMQIVSITEVFPGLITII
jgi:hypothetical protein